jgi:hypothetical protein
MTPSPEILLTSNPSSPKPGQKPVLEALTVLYLPHKILLICQEQ